MRIKANILQRNDQLVGKKHTYTILNDGIRVNKNMVIYQAYESDQDEISIIKECIPILKMFKKFKLSLWEFWETKILNRFIKEKLVNVYFKSVKFDKEIYNKELCKIFTEFSIMKCKQKGKFLYEINRNGDLKLEDITKIIYSILHYLEGLNESSLFLDIYEFNIYFPYYSSDYHDYSNPIFINYDNIFGLNLDGKSNYLNLDRYDNNANYVLPEIKYMKDPIRLGKESEVYLVGRLLLYLLTGEEYVKNGTDRLLYDQSVTLLTLNRCKKINCNDDQRILLYRILNKALALNPDQRYHNVTEMLDDLKQVMKAGIH